MPDFRVTTRLVKLNVDTGTRLSYLTEKYALLPDNHFGGRRGRSTDDAITLLVEKIKNEWRRGNVVSTLQIDVQSAFTTVDCDRLVAILRKKGIPGALIGTINSFLKHRRTALKVGSYTSAPEPTQAGIPQGSGLSALLYIFYNAELLEATTKKTTFHLLNIVYIDDVTFVATGRTVQEARTGLEALQRHCSK